MLYSFKGPPADGANPSPPLINVNGTLYGVTANGGASYCAPTGGCGTVFSITMSGKETALYSFKGGTTDGQDPRGGLVNVGRKLYGTTDGGGANCQNGVACGTVYSITRSGKETVSYSFKGGTTDGQNPQAGFIYFNGALYGTTTGGGTYNAGTVFAISPTGAEHVVHSFGNLDTSGVRPDGSDPQAALLNVNGKLYGTTASGGSNYSNFGGTLFEITRSGKERVLHRFGAPDDGDNPMGSLINVNGMLYGTTGLGGSVFCSTTTTFDDERCGTVFTLRP